jgi:hypothetical protein
MASFALAPLGAFACGDSMAYDDAPDKLGMQAPPAASKAPVTVAKTALPKTQQPVAKQAKAPAPDQKVKVAASTQ